MRKAKGADISPTKKFIFSGNHTGLPLRIIIRFIRTTPPLDRGGIGGVVFGGSKPPPYDINIDYLYEESEGSRHKPYEKRLIFSGNHTGLPLRIIIRFIIVQPLHRKRSPSRLTGEA